MTPFVKQKNIAPFCPETIIPIILPYHHFTISRFNHFTIPPRCYNYEPMHYNKKISDKIKMSKDNSNLIINPYKHNSRYKKDNQTDNSTAEKKKPDFSEFLQVQNEVK